MLAWVVERARLASLPEEVVVATTTDESDDEVQAYCQERGFPTYRGHPRDVLDRYYHAAQSYGAAVVVRLTADCPFIDPGLIDETVGALLSTRFQADFAANRLPWKRTYPIGLDVEVCTQEALAAAWAEARDPHQREHVMPYLYEHPERFKIVQIDAEADYGRMRWTVDTNQDLAFIREVAAHLPDRSDFDWRDVLAFLAEHPEIMKINASVKHKTHRDVG